MKTLFALTLTLITVSAQASEPLLQGKPYDVLEAAFQNAAPTTLDEAAPLCMDQQKIFRDSGLRMATPPYLTDAEITPKTNSIRIDSTTFLCRTPLDIVLSPAVPGSGSLFPGKPAITESYILIGTFRIDAVGKNSPATINELRQYAQENYRGGIRQEIKYQPDLTIETSHPANEQRKFCPGNIAIQRNTFRTLNNEFIVKLESICPSDPSKNRTSGYWYYGRW